MPANLTPEYMKAEQEYKEARDTSEKLAALKKMLSTIPKHKGTDKLQADLKRRIARTKKEADRERRSGKRGLSYRITREGAGQVVLLGPPSSGKSALLDAVTRASPEVAAYPFTTHAPQPGMMPHEDIAFQLVDLPPITADYMPAWMKDIIRSADAALLMANLSTDSVLEDLDSVRARLREGKIRLVREAPDVDRGSSPVRYLRALLVGARADAPGARERWEILRELDQEGLEGLTISAQTGEGLAELGRLLFRLLDIIRVYSKQPGHEADLSEPFVLPRGGTVLDVARAVHNDVATSLQTARLWGSAAFDGQHVSRDHPLEDGDIVELHT